MTTICYKNGFMSSDGRMTLGETIIKEDTVKVYSINGHLAGVCGRASAISTFMSWLQKHTDYSIINSQVGDLVDLIPPKLENDPDGYSALVVTPDKQVLMYDSGVPIDMGTDVPMSIGSGSVYALAAMDAGLSAEEAVKVAMKRDVFSGGTITTVQLEEEPEELTREVAESLGKDELIEMMFGPKDDVEGDESNKQEPVKEEPEDELVYVKKWDINETITLCTVDGDYFFEADGVEFTATSPFVKEDMKEYAQFDISDLVSICARMNIELKNNNYVQLVKKISDEVQRAIKDYEQSNM